MDQTDIKLLNEIAKGIPLVPEPFSEIAKKLQITPKETISRITQLQEKGIIRRFGASIKPNNLGLSANALIAWKIPEKRIQEVGIFLSGFEGITHCYQRKTIAGKWDYNLYTVMHSHERKIVEQNVKTISKAIEIHDYIILYSIKDLKKSNTTTSLSHLSNLSEKTFGDNSI